MSGILIFFNTFYANVVRGGSKMSMFSREYKIYTTVLWPKNVDSPHIHYQCFMAFMANLGFEKY